MLLLVDVGNTRVKWASVGHDGTLSSQRAATYADWTVDDWHRELFAARAYQKVVASTVAGSRSRELITAAASRNSIADVRFVATSASAGGVRSAYPNPALLGVDRWVAVIGAWELKRGACCVADIGTAATLDAVDATGRHLGGFIVPGPELMVRSLLHSTSDLATHTAASRSNARATLADNTRDAIERGCRVALAAFVDRTFDDLARDLGAATALLLTGGAADEVRPYLRTAVEHVPDLVLHGLARLALEPGA